MPGCRRTIVRCAAVGHDKGAGVESRAWLGVSAKEPDPRIVDDGGPGAARITQVRSAGVAQGRVKPATPTRRRMGADPDATPSRRPCGRIWIRVGRL